MGKKRDLYRTARASGYFPLTFNFVRRRDGKYIQCAYCGKFVYYRKITRDHIYPKSKGGVIKAPACYPCNEDKEDMLPIDWAIHASKRAVDIAVIPIGAEFLYDEYEERDSLLMSINTLFGKLIRQKRMSEWCRGSTTVFQIVSGGSNPLSDSILV